VARTATWLCFTSSINLSLSCLKSAPTLLSLLFGLSFPCPELYTLANSPSDTIMLAHYAAQHLTSAVVGRRLKDPFAHW
jgi:hypothetical protein